MYIHISICVCVTSIEQTPVAQPREKHQDPDLRRVHHLQRWALSEFLWL